MFADMPLVVCDSDSLEECLDCFVGHWANFMETIIVMAQANEIMFSAFGHACEPSRNHTPYILVIIFLWEYKEAVNIFIPP